MTQKISQTRANSASDAELGMIRVLFVCHRNNIRCPVTILCGKKDTANLKASKRLKELLPQATLHIVPNAGHELNKYAPNTIAEILNQ